MKLSARVHALSQRERAMVLAALLAVVWVVFDTLLFSPVLQKQKLYRLEIAARQGEVAKLQQQQIQIIQVAQADPDAGRKANLARLQQQVTKMDAELQAKGRELVTPEHMPRVLESVLRKDRQLKLVSVTTLPMSGLMDGVVAGKDAKAPAFGIYKHGFQVTLEGGYFDLQRYVAALESSPWRMLWGGFDLNADAYPKSTLTLTLYTLSLDQAWLSI